VLLVREIEMTKRSPSNIFDPPQKKKPRRESSCKTQIRADAAMGILENKHLVRAKGEKDERQERFTTKTHAYVSGWANKKAFGPERDAGKGKGDPEKWTG